MKLRPGPAKKAILIGTDGASMELWRRMAAWGRAPNMKKLLETGVSRPMLGTHPTLTPCGWTSLFSGSWQGTHGIMWWGSHREGESMKTAQWTMAAHTSKSEQIWTTAERAGKTPIMIKQEITWPANLERGMQIEGSGPGVSNYHQISGYHLFVSGNWRPRPVGGTIDPEATDPSRGGSDAPYDYVELQPATGWVNLPSSSLEPLQTVVTLTPLKRGRTILHRGHEGTPQDWDILIYASGDEGYDRVLVTENKDDNGPFADLGVGEWADWRLKSFEIDGENVEGYVNCKLITLSANADNFELFFPQIWPRRGYSNPPSVSDEIDEKVGNFLQNPARDALGFVDDRTYIELCDFHHGRIADIAEMLTRDHDWDILMAETHATDYSDHFFMGSADPISGATPDVVERCLNGLKDTYESTDKMIGRLMDLADEDTVICIVSDHGATPNRSDPPDIKDILVDAGLLVFTDTPSNQDAARTGPLGPGEVPDRVDWDVMMQNKFEVDFEKSVAIPMNSIDIFIPVKDRDPEGHVEPENYEKVQRKIIDTLMSYIDPATGEHPFSVVVGRQDAEMLNIWGTSAGDVIYALRPEFDGVHGKHLPSSVFGIGSQHSTFVLAGAGVRNGVELDRKVQVVDVAPTLCHLLGLPMPENVEGGVVYEALEDPNWYLRA